VSRCRFDLHVGIDYSGASTVTRRQSGLQLCVSSPDGVVAVPPPEPKRTRWTRKGIAAFLLDLCRQDATVIIGIDHALSFPQSYFDRTQLADWNTFLADFCAHWPTHLGGNTVQALREGNPRSDSPDELRLTERWTSSAKSVFRFDVQGQFTNSTHAALPWVAYLREQLGDRLHLWPFDGWSVPTGKHALVEVYSSIFRNRYPHDGRTIDQQDAYSAARWLSEVDAGGRLEHYLNPPLSADEASQARREGWIIGIT